MNEQQYQEYLAKIQRGEKPTESERIRAQQFMQSNYGRVPLGDTSSPMLPDSSNPFWGTGSWSVPQNNDTVDEMTQYLSTLETSNTPTDLSGIINPNTGALEQPKKRNPWELDPNALPFLYPGGSDLQTKLHTFGRTLGMEKGTPGRGLTMAGAGLGAAAEMTRGILSGVGYANRSDELRQWYKDQQNKQMYQNVSASNTTNNRGGFTQFEEGGQMIQPLEQGMQQPPQEQEQIQQMVEAVAGALQQGAQPEQVVEMLMQQGLQQEQAVMFVQEVMAMMQGGQQQVPQEMMPEQTMPSVEQPQEQMMKFGGKKVGDLVSFKYGGKKVSGRIKRIDKDKIYI